MKHLVPLLLALTPACVVPLREADLRPIARNDAPPIAVTVSAAAASDDLVRPSDQTAGDLSTLVLRVHLHNAAATAYTEQPARYRLNVVGADGRRVSTVAAAWAPGDLPSAVPERLPEGAATSVTVPPGGTVTLTIAFRGLAGLPLSAPARIDLVLPDQRTVPVSVPATGAQWTTWRHPRALLLRGGFSWQGPDQLTEIGMQLVLARGPVLFGMTIMDHGTLVLKNQLGAYHAGGLGLFAGIQPHEWLGVTAGADGLWGLGPLADGVQRADLWQLRTYAALRIMVGQPSGVGGGVLPVRHRTPSPLRSLAFDIGYAYTFTHGAHPNGGGLLVLVGAPIASF